MQSVSGSPWAWRAPSQAAGSHGVSRGTMEAPSAKSLNPLFCELWMQLIKFLGDSHSAFPSFDC